jgi:hypothetical protein
MAERLDESDGQGTCAEASGAKSERVKREIAIVLAALSCVPIGHFSGATPPVVEDTAATSSPTPAPLSVTLGALRTEAANAGIRLAADYVENTFDKSARVFADANSRNVFLLVPEAHILTGDKDAFQGIVAKLTGLETFFPRDIEIPGGVSMPNLDATIQTMPFAAGVESDGKFKNVDALLEVGYVPWLPPPFRFRVRPGIFLQGGYKFARGTSPTGTSAGDTDQSSEPGKSGLLRGKQSLVIDSWEWPLLTTPVKFKVMGSADVWEDIVNSAIYHRVTGTFRIIISKDRYWDMKYEHGSGAPNFNRGDQFSTNITVAF